MVVPAQQDGVIGAGAALVVPPDGVVDLSLIRWSGAVGELTELVPSDHCSGLGRCEQATRAARVQDLPFWTEDDAVELPIAEQLGRLRRCHGGAIGPLSGRRATQCGMVEVAGNRDAADT